MPRLRSCYLAGPKQTMEIAEPISNTSSRAASFSEERPAIGGERPATGAHTGIAIADSDAAKTASAGPKPKSLRRYVGS